MAWRLEPRARCRWQAACGCGMALACAAAGPFAHADPGGWPPEVSAVYIVKFNGLSIGSFRFRSKTGPQTYAIEGGSKFSALLGAFRWKGTFEAAGRSTEDGPQPARYAFGYKASRGPWQKGSVTMAFGGGSVSSVTLDPPAAPSKQAVPVEARHLAAVLDPLSAVMALSRAGDRAPCERQVPVFDGKYRFDLVFSPKRREPPAGTAEKSGAPPDNDPVCRVHVKFLAGHKPHKVNKAFTEGRIEIALRHIPAANLLVPQRIAIPTEWGWVSLQVKRMEIVTQGRENIAFGQR